MRRTVGSAARSARARSGTGGSRASGAACGRRAPAGISRQAVELRPRVVDREVGVADDRVRPAGLVGDGLHPGGLVRVKVLRPVGLDVDGARHARAGDVGEELARSDSRAGSARRGRRCGAASGREARAGRPAARRGGGRRRSPITPPSPDRGGERRPPRRCEPSPRSSRKGRTAFSASVSGEKSGPAASGVSQDRRQARRERRATASRIAAGSPRSSPSERTATKAPRA